MGEINLFTSLM